MKKFKKNIYGRNYIIAGDNYLLSYTPCTSGFFGGGGLEETAIRYHDTWFILNGDFRKEYEQLIKKGIEECINFFMAHKDFWSEWSTFPNKLSPLDK